jgi:hypothetical protein
VGLFHHATPTHVSWKPLAPSATRNPSLNVEETARSLARVSTTKGNHGTAEGGSRSPAKLAEPVRAYLVPKRYLPLPLNQRRVADDMAWASAVGP